MISGPRRRMRTRSKGPGGHEEGRSMRNKGEGSRKKRKRKGEREKVQRKKRGRREKGSRVVPPGWRFGAFVICVDRAVGVRGIPCCTLRT